MAEDWGPFGNLGVSRKEILLIFFSFIGVLKIDLKIFDLGEMGNYTNVRWAMLQTHFST
jgi:hypothetical protein